MKTICPLTKILVILGRLIEFPFKYLGSTETSIKGDHTCLYIISDILVHVKKRITIIITTIIY